MKIDWRNHIAEEEIHIDFRELVEHRLHRVLRFFPHRVTGVRVYINDINGTRGGIDKQVRVHVTGSPFGDVVVSATGLTLHGAASVAVLKVGSAVHRAIQKRRTRRHRARRAPVRPVSAIGPERDLANGSAIAMGLKSPVVADAPYHAVRTT